ncbi:MAG: carbohydrate ABC transporter permease [Oscillospiraceae bacterium]|nr:carbohydrate ABC transporter permease [Oscillospiraceae bacterium]
MNKSTPGMKAFSIFNYLFLSALAVTCLLPMVNQLAISFSSSGAVGMGLVQLWPVNPTLEAYRYMAEKPQFFASVGVSLQRILLAVPLSMLLTVLAAYPLSRHNHEWKARKYYIWLFVIPMLFSGGLIPTYMVVRDTKLINTILALVFPSAVNMFNTILMMNFYRGIPKEMEEAALIDGAGHVRVLTSIILPVSAPVLATVTLFFIVNHWNAWFDGLIYMNSPTKYPLQTYMRTQVFANDLMSMEAMRDVRETTNVSDRTGKAAQIFLAVLPILCVYPFLQKYFTTGIVMGSVKG